MVWFVGKRKQSKIEICILQLVVCNRRLFHADDTRLQMIQDYNWRKVMAKIGCQ
jgi:hypothetical protein